MVNYKTILLKAEDLRDEINQQPLEPRAKAMLLRYLEDFEDKLFGVERRGKREGGVV